jgi:RNA polymerase sigma-70 factor (ECF subfamily)
MIEARSTFGKAELYTDEAVWLDRCRGGDETALAQLVAKHRNRLIRTAANILRDPVEAEDVAQEAFLKAFRELRNLRENRAFAGYLYRIAVRLCMDRLRSRRPQTCEFEASELDEGERVDNRLLVERLLKLLPYDLRTTLTLREMEQLSYEEIAVATHVPVGTVRSRLHSAREKFRTLWLDATREAR